MKVIPIRSRVGGAWIEKAHGWWLHLEITDVRDAAWAMRVDGVRFAALTVCPDGTHLRLAWHWDCGGELHTVEARLAPGQLVPSIVDLWPGADWAEREARDYYAVTFTGRQSTPPLMLREADRPGILLRSENGEQA